MYKVHSLFIQLSLQIKNIVGIIGCSRLKLQNDFIYKIGQKDLIARSKQLLQQIQSDFIMYNYGVVYLSHDFLFYRP